MKWTATLKVTFEMELGQPDSLAKTVLMREVGQFRQAIERGSGIGRTGVKPGSAKIDILSQGPAE